jgi:hypothetical protein
MSNSEINISNTKIILPLSYNIRDPEFKIYTKIEGILIMNLLPPLSFLARNIEIPFKLSFTQNKQHCFFREKQTTLIKKSNN